MSDRSPGPGWWLASDGHWYPPEQAPAAAPAPVSWAPPSGPAWTPDQPFGVPPPTPEPPKDGGPITTLAIILGGLLTLAIVALLVVGFVQRGDDDNADDVAAVDDPSGDGTGSTTVPGPTSVPDDFEVVTDEVAGFSMALPPSWLGVPTDGDVEGLGARSAPDDPELARTLDALVSALPRQVSFIGVDTDAIGQPFVTNLSVSAIPRGTTTHEQLVEQAGGGAEAFGATDVRVGQVPLPAGDAVRVNYTLQPPNGPELRGEQYYLIVDDQVWILTFTTSQEGADPFDQMAASFQPG